MSEAKFTQGGLGIRKAWDFEQDEPEFEIYPLKNGLKPKAGFHWAEIATIKGDNAKYDAKLFVTAPEMYGIIASPEFQEMIELSFEHGGRLKELAKMLNPQRIATQKKARGET